MNSCRLFEIKLKLLRVPRNKKSTIKNHCKHHQLRLRQKSVSLPRGQEK